MAGNRLISLDVFRGLTIAGMILVNNPGTSPVYWPLEHAAWHGLTPTDWIFPFFLFIVGVAIPISFAKYTDRNPTRREGARDGDAGNRYKLYLKIITRSISIFLLGLAISVLPFFQFSSTDAPDWVKMLVWLAFTAALFFLLLRKHRIAVGLGAAGIIGIIVMDLAGFTVVAYNFGTMRVMGVLQRIAVCYLAASLIFLHTNWKQQLGIATAILLAYWFLMTAIPVPGCEITTIDDKACNLAAYMDRLILGENHIWRFGKVYDPEGLLSTLPAIATTLSGVWCGKWITTAETQRRREAAQNGFVAHLALDTSRLSLVSGMFFFGTILVAFGWFWNSYFPMNKSLWTSSYVVTTTGLALLMFACCYWLIDIKGYKRWASPFVVFGVNALALFVFSGVFARMVSAFRVAYTEDGKGISAQKWLVDNIFLAIFQPINASLAYAICFILFWLLLLWLLYRKKTYIRV